MSPIVRVAAVLLLAAIVLPGVLSACPLCKDATPDAAVGTVAFLIFRRRRRDRAALPAGGVAHLVPDSRGARS